MIAFSCHALLGTALLVGACLRPLGAQAWLPADGWAFTGVFTTIGLIDGNFQLITTTPGTNGGGYIAGDNDGGTALYTTRTGLVQWSYSLASYFTAHGILIAPPEGAWSVDTTRDWVYFADRFNRRLSRCRKGIWNQTSVFLADPQMNGISGGLRDICTNGRDLFFSVDVSANDAYHIFALDVQDPAHPSGRC